MEFAAASSDRNADMVTRADGYNGSSRSPKMQLMTSTAPAQPSAQANAENRYEVTRADLPLACPMPSMALWNSHPRVYLPIEEEGSCKCPYCGALYVLID
jgi:uncharacterized Zn-finger protein